MNDLLLTDEEIRKLLPVDDGYSYYKEFGKKVSKETLSKVLMVMMLI